MKRLIIAPHVDDDVLGCGGIIDETCVVFYCGVDLFHRVSAAARFEETLAVHAETGARFWWPVMTSRPATEYHSNSLMRGAYVMRQYRDRRAQIHVPDRRYITARLVNSYDMLSLIQDIEAVLDVEKPHEVYIPEVSSYNQDHRMVHEAALVATRPHDENWFAPRVLAYEQPHVVFWPIEPIRHPQYFRKIDIERKIRLYNLMASQVREHRSEQDVRALAHLRGKSIKQPAAEAFRVLRFADLEGDDEDLPGEA